MKTRILMVIAIGIATAALADDVDDALIHKYYPDVLTRMANRDEYPEHRQQAFAQWRDGGTSYVFAAYSNSQVGAVVLLEAANDDTVKVDQMIFRPFSGGTPQVLAQDLDHDGKPEAVVTFIESRGGATTWIFRVKDHALELVSPVDKQGWSLLTLPDLVDMDGKGVVDVIEVATFGSRQEPRVENQHYVLQAGKYVAAAPLDFYETFYMQPGPQVGQFSIPASLIGKPFRMSIINGNDSGSCRVSKAVITLNGVKVSSGDDFSEHRNPGTIPVTLQQQNTLRVDVGTGDKESEHGDCGRIRIAIRHD